MIFIPRSARIKTPDSMFHIMTHSISELSLFRDTTDKDVFLGILKKAKLKFHFKVYAFCLMDTHTHLIIDCFGADISKIMHYTNLCYSIYYNAKYSRKGPLFQDRFKSKLITTYQYLVNLIAYIHINPKDLPPYSDNILNYQYSSLRDYIYNTNTFGILNPHFVIQLLGFNQHTNKLAYLRLLNKSIPNTILDNIELPMNKSEYRSEFKSIPRLSTPDTIIQYVSNRLELPTPTLRIKYNSHYSKLRALTCFMLNSFSSLSQKQICRFLGNITQSRVSSLIKQGLNFVEKDLSIVNDFITANTF
ncbi:MAG: transposase [Cellulosilyticaceae bacterium]